jgi:hypothetical protein
MAGAIGLRCALAPVQASDDPKEFPGQRAAERASFNDVQSRTLEFYRAWSRQDAKKANPERAPPHPLLAPKPKPTSDEDNSAD